jgi:hypothetical protein
MKLKLSGFIHVVLKLFHFFGAHCSSNIQSVKREEESDRQTDRHLEDGVCSVTCKAKYRDVMLSSETVQFTSLFLLTHTVCSRTVAIPPVPFPQPKETPSLQTSFPPNV